MGVRKNISKTEQLINYRLYHGDYSVDVITEFETKYGELKQFVCVGHDSVVVPCPVHYPLDYVLWVFSYKEDTQCECYIDEKYCPVHAIRDFNNGNFYLLNIREIRGMRIPSHIERLIVGGSND